MGSGTLYIRSPRLEETADHVSRLSIRLMLNGRQWYKVGGLDRVVHADNFLVINQGQHYRTAFTGTGEGDPEMLMVGFRPGMAQEVRRALDASPDQLLDDPWAPVERFAFFEQTYPMDQEVRNLFARLHALVRVGNKEGSEPDVSGIHDRLMERLLLLQFRISHRANQLSGLKRSTRLELWRRLYMARDFIEAHLETPIAVTDMARVACLSEYHFKRSFLEAFGIPPGTYLRQARMRRARAMLLRHRYTLTEVAQAVGYTDLSAFGRAYRRVNGNSPGLER